MAKSSQELNGILNRVLQRALSQTLSSCAPNHDWQYRPVDEIEQITHKQTVVLTIASFRFRVMALMHLTLDPSTREFIALNLGSKPEDLDESQYQDYLLELANQFCGHLKRNLQNSCPPLGMSTPNFLDRSCLVFDGVIDFAYRVHTAALVDYGSTPIFVASALVSLQGNHDLHLENFAELDQEMREEFDNSGALELF